jgi:hypothetical protein
MKTHVVVGFQHNRVFRADTLFIHTENAVGARSAQWLISDNAYLLSMDAKVSASLARTAAVRADRRSRADEKRIRTH